MLVSAMPPFSLPQNVERSEFGFYFFFFFLLLNYNLTSSKSYPEFQEDWVRVLCIVYIFKRVLKIPRSSDDLDIRKSRSRAD